MSEQRTAAQIWQACLGELTLQMTKATYDTWVKPTFAISLESNILTIGVRNAYARQWLANRLHGMIERTVEHVSERRMVVNFVLKDTPPEIAPPPTVSAHGKTPPPPNDPDKPPTLKGGDVVVSKFQNPTQPFVMIQKYACMYWQPYLEQQARGAFATWFLLRCADKSFDTSITNKRRINVAIIAAMVGVDRQLILGRTRTAKGGEKWYDMGAFDVLVRERLARVEKVQGKNVRDVVYSVQVITELPLLTPAQVATLPPEVQRWHTLWLSDFKYDLDRWGKVEAATFIEEWAATL